MRLDVFHVVCYLYACTSLHSGSCVCVSECVNGLGALARLKLAKLHVEYIGQTY